MSKDTPVVKHWSDIAAERIIRDKGDKDVYTVASGITPSGTVHFGNFREVMTVDLVARALRRAGKKVRFIFSWDDYDTFRKIPKNMPKQDLLENFLFQPIVDTPDPYGETESYARRNEVKFESVLPKVGIETEFLYQAKKYRAGDYKDKIISALNKTTELKEILNEYRSKPLADDWLPVSIYCPKNKTDKVSSMKWDSENKTISYKHENGDEGLVDLNKKEDLSHVKLGWRIDWPMRWCHEDVDFEPGGKDHSSEGGSYTTAKLIVDKVYGAKPPVYVQYDFVSIKGAGGKMSSSSGEVITVDDVLNVYEPEMVRWIFASYKTNVDFAISFDLDVIKTYEDYDRQERLAFGVDEGNAKKVGMAKRVMELSQIGSEMPAEIPFQPAFRHLTNILQINDGDISKAREAYAGSLKNERDERRFKERSSCALFWLENYAPEEFKFSVNKEKISQEFDEDLLNFKKALRTYIDDSFDNLENDKELHEKIYDLMSEHNVKEKMSEVFKMLYMSLISKVKGPKLAGFIRTIGKERVLSLL